MNLHYIDTFYTKNGPNSNKVGKGHNLPFRGGGRQLEEQSSSASMKNDWRRKSASQHQYVHQAAVA